MALTITADQAREIQVNSEVAYQRLLDTAKTRIVEAAQKGEKRCLFPSDGVHNERLKNELKEAGFILDRYSNDVWNEAIKW